MKNPSKNHFDPEKKEAELQRDSRSWDTNRIEQAEAGDIPTIDVRDYFQKPCDETLRPLAGQLKEACTKVGFFSLTGHQFPELHCKMHLPKHVGFISYRLNPRMHY